MIALLSLDLSCREQGFFHRLAADSAQPRTGLGPIGRRIEPFCRRIEAPSFLNNRSSRLRLTPPLSPWLINFCTAGGCQQSQKRRRVSVP
jgi:hypothetical protein